MKHSLEFLRLLLEYDPATGLFTWKHRPTSMFSDPAHAKTWNARYAGKAAGNIGTNGYVEIQIRTGTDGRGRYYAHRLAWLFVHGVVPDGQIDHVNGLRSDNRIANLRDVSLQENRMNQRLRKTNTSGEVGVSWCAKNNKWHVRVARKHIGYFSNFDRAVQARDRAYGSAGFHPNHGSIIEEQAA